MQEVDIHTKVSSEQVSPAFGNAMLGAVPLSEVYLEDCVKGLKRFPDNHFDLAIVDPPYGIGYSELVGKKKTEHRWKKRAASQWDNETPKAEYFEQLFRVSKNQIIWGGNYFDLPPTRCFIIWDKVQRIDQADCEFAWTSFNGSARVFQYARGNESGFAPKLKGVERAGINIHPTQKPIALYTWVLSKFAKEGDLILDTHLGSGSSRIAARKGGFNFVGFEIDENYYEAQEKRFQTFISQLRMF
jgi:site-specific DNA-methyltransferase (adenine-specific)